jgi:hypothetical protein
MSNITVSSAVDTMLQSANNSAILTNIGAIGTGFFGTFTGDIGFDGEVVFNGQVETDNITVNGTADFQDEVLFEGDVDASNAGTFSLNEITVNGSADFQDEVLFEGDVDASNAGTFSLNEITVNGSAEFQDSVELSDGDLEFTAGGGQSIIMDGGTISGGESIEATILKSSGVNPSSISASNGMIIYNTSTNKFQGYANGAWVDLHS